MKEMVGGCCVCSDERGWDENPLVYCDGPGCNVAVHQGCYGIIAVPSGPWFCKKCEPSERSAGRVRCELCPSRDGAFKKTDTGSWAHVVCGLYIPEVRFENVSTMEKIMVSLIPQERYNKTCYICEERGDKKEIKSMHQGACMSCNKAGCKQNFHVTCAQMQGLLCEEAGNYSDNVTYCGYCKHHYSKLKRTSNIKIVPPFKPIPSSGNTTDSPTSSPEKSNVKSSTLTSGPEVPTSQSQSPGTSVGGTIGGDNPLKSSSGSKSSSRKSSGNGKASSVSSGSSNGSSHKNSSSSSAMPRIQIQPSNLFNSSGGFSSYASLMNPNGNGNSDSGKHRSKSRSPSTDETPATTKSEKGSSSSGGGKKSYGKSNDEELDENPKSSDTNSKGSKQGSQHDHLGSGSSSTFISSSYGGKHKDLATVSMKEVLSSALDKPISSTGSKFDRTGSSAALTSGISEASSTYGPGSGRNLDKPPPDIVPHVTLTPIPMKSAEEPKLDNRSSRSKSPASFPSTFGQVGKLEPMETEMATLEKTSPGKRMRIPLHSSPPQQLDSDTESATEEWSVTEDASRSQSNSHNTLPQKEHVSRRDQGHGPGTGASRVMQPTRRMLTATQASEMSHWESRKSPTVFLERVTVPTAPALEASAPGTKEQREAPVQFPFGSSSAYPLDYAPAGRKRGRPTLNKAQGGGARDEDSRGKGPAGKRGRRGSVTNYNRREALPNGSSGGMLDDNAGDGGKLDEGEMNGGSSVGGGRGGRHSGGHGRKGAPATLTSAASSTSLQNSPTVSRKPNYDDAPTLTMSQLKAQMSASSTTSTPEKNASLAPHMFGNALNPASSMAQHMVDTLSQEMETIAASGESQQDNMARSAPPLVGIPFPGKSSGGAPKLNGVATATNGATTAGVPKPQQPQTLEELLERQWEQGSQFLMEQAQHLDISQLLSCLNQLKADNKALEDHVQSLYQRKDQLTAINARLSNPLGSTNTLGLGLGFGGGNSGRQETPPVPAIQAKQPSVPPPPPAHPQQHHAHVQQQQEGGHQGSRYASSHKYPGYEPAGSHGYPPQQGHHRGSNQGNLPSQTYGYAGGQSSSGQGTSAHPHHPSHSHQQAPPRDSRQ